MSQESGAETLSSEEYELLQRAYQQGYFEVPRKVTLVDLAEQQDIPDREASEKLREGLHSVLEDVELETLKES